MPRKHIRTFLCEGLDERGGSQLVNWRWMSWFSRDEGFGIGNVDTYKSVTPPLFSL